MCGELCRVPRPPVRVLETSACSRHRVFGTQNTEPTEGRITMQAIDPAVTWPLIIAFARF